MLGNKGSTLNKNAIMQREKQEQLTNNTNNFIQIDEWDMLPLY